MRAFIVPVISGATVAATSLVFYALFNRVFDNNLLGAIIILQSIASILQMTIVPQNWLYVLSATDSDQLNHRYALSTQIEMIAGLIGTIIMLAVTYLPIKILTTYRWESILIFIGLWASGSSSHQGYFRAKFQWLKFSTFVIFPSVIRLLAIVVIMLVPSLIDKQHSTIIITAVFFCVPDVVRFLVANALSWRNNFQILTLEEILSGLRRIVHNWLFDFGSGIVENVDKLLVGWLVSPTMLIVYFFARRIGGAATIAIEPLYAELFRRIQNGSQDNRKRKEVIAFAIGTGVAFSAALTLSFAFLLLEYFSEISRYIPSPVSQYYDIFIALLLVDSGVCANRWARFLFQQGFGSTILLIVRLTLRGIFGLVLMLATHFGLSSGIVYSYFVMFVCELVFMILVLSGYRFQTKRLS